MNQTVGSVGQNGGSLMLTAARDGEGVAGVAAVGADSSAVVNIVEKPREAERELSVSDYVGVTNVVPERGNY